MKNINICQSTSNVSSRFKIRVIFYSTISIFIFVLHMLKGNKISPNFIDFSIFYTAGRFALSGNATGVYDINALSEAIETLSGYSNHVIPLAWLYQPYVLLFFIPFAMLPYCYSLSLWIISGVFLYMFCVYKYTNNKSIFLPILAFPGFWYNVLWGQQTFFLAAFIGLAFYYMYKKPAVSSLLLSIALVKPHLILSCFIPLIMTKRWKVGVYTSLIYISYILISLLVFPQQIWSAYQGSINWISSTLFNPNMILKINLSTYNMLMLLGYSTKIALITQVIISILSICLLYICWCKKGKNIFTLQIAAIFVTCVLITPYTLQYDFALIGIALAIYYNHVLQNGWSFKYELYILSITWLSPALCMTIVMFFKIQTAPIFLLIFLMSIYKRINRYTKQGCL